MKKHTIGIDLGKTSFHLVGLNECGEVVVRKKLSRAQLRPNLACGPTGRSGMPEATVEDKRPGHVTFLLNFFDELRRKVLIGK